LLGARPLRRTIPREIVLIGDVEGLDDRLHRSIRSSSFARRSSRISCGINPL